MKELRLKDFSYDYPNELVAQYPANPRDHSRLMHLDRDTGKIRGGYFYEIEKYFKEGDVLVLNDTKVFPARLLARRPGGGRQEILLIRPDDETEQLARAKIWRVLINHARQVRAGQKFIWGKFSVEILSDSGPERLAELSYNGDLLSVLKSRGHVPLPPYMQRQDEKSDLENYQTVIAKNTGSVAAPTAALHFTHELLKKLEKKGVQIATVTLHVGPGTFLPVRTDDISQHRMHAEYFSITPKNVAIIREAKKEKRSITAVGTTATRVLETLALTDFLEQSGMTDIFITPGFKFRVVDRLITNFHQPESTLLMLVSAFAGRENILKAYKKAIKEKYRLFSYGDAMFIGAT